MMHAYSGPNRQPLQPWQMQPFAGYARERHDTPQSGADFRLVKGPAAVGDMLAMIASIHQISERDIMGLSRRKPIAHARQHLMAALYALRTPEGRLRFSTVQIGQFLNRDHSTVISGIRAHAARLASQGAA